MALKKWQLLKSDKKNPSPWFPYEVRTYKMPDGTVVDDFYISTLADSVHIIAQTVENKIILIKMYKQGVDDLMIQWPAGRFEEKKHNSLQAAAVAELKEETGILVQKSDLKKVGTLALGSTKQTEKIHYFFVSDVRLFGQQKLDKTEQIEVLQYSPTQIDEMILTGEIWDAPCIAGWELTKKRFALE